MKSGASQRNGDFIEIRWGSVKWEEKESHSRRWTLREHSRTGAGKAGKPTKRPRGPPESWSVVGKKKKKAGSMNSGCLGSSERHLQVFKRERHTYVFGVLENVFACGLQADYRWEMM